MSKLTKIYRFKLYVLYTIIWNKVKKALFPDITPLFEARLSLAQAKRKSKDSYNGQGNMEEPER